MSPIRCAIATPHGAATEAAERAIADGGNAIDAALAAAIALTVVYPHMCAVGGDLFALLRDPDGTVTSIDASGAAAMSTDADELRSRVSRMPVSGPDTVTVPGAPGGWEALHGLGGQLPLKAHFAGASDLARDGVPVAPSLARAIHEHESLIREDVGMTALLTRDGVALREGDALIQPELAGTFDELAEHGADGFYKGDLASRFTEGIRKLGCGLTAEDLRDHRTDLSPALTGRFAGLDIATSPPGSQGFVLLEILAAIEASDCLERRGGIDPALLAQLFRLSSRDRDTYLADPRHTEVPLDRLLSPQHAERMLDEAKRSLRDAGESGPPPGPRPSGDTVAVVAVDDEGRAVSLIQSVFHAFGSGLLEPSTGIICHNRGACFSLDPESPNLIHPGVRPAHTLMPVIVSGKVTLAAHGTMGGRAQAQIHAQLLLRRIAGRSPERAVAEPRFVVGGPDAGTRDDIVIAESGLERGVIKSLEGSRMELKIGEELDEMVGHSQMAVAVNGRLDAATDPRADGRAAVCGGDQDGAPS